MADIYSPENIDRSCVRARAIIEMVETGKLPAADWTSVANDMLPSADERERSRKSGVSGRAS